jgi:hypothetical protein
MNGAASAALTCALDCEWLAAEAAAAPEQVISPAIRAVEATVSRIM